MFKKIRYKFLAAFVLCVSATLIITIIVGYRKVNDVYQNLNDNITKTEYSKISGDIENGLTEIIKSLNAEIVPSLSFAKPLQQGRLSSLDRIEAVQTLKKKTDTIFRNYPDVKSLYILLGNGDLLVFSEKHTRTLQTGIDGSVSGELLAYVLEPSPDYAIIGNTHSSQFPLDEADSYYLSICRRMTPSYGSAVIILNLSEDAVSSSYRDYLADGVRKIFVINSEGVIISSADKKEIGTVYGDYIKKDQPYYSINKENEIVSVTRVSGYDIKVVGIIPKTLYARELGAVLYAVLFCFSICMVAVSIFFFQWIRKHLKPLAELQSSMKKAGQGDYSEKLTPVGNDELTAITVGYNTMLTELKELEDSEKEQENELRELEMTALRNEINPHFLYNTLNTIKCMADIDGNEEVARCTVALGSIVASLYKIKKPCWTLGEEGKIIEKYVEIMNVRYGNGIELNNELPEEYFGKMIPKFILQPVVENAILHGFENNAFHGRIRLLAMEQNGELILLVDDTGCGLSEMKLQELNESLMSGKEFGGVGLKNVSRRIALRCGSGFGIAFESSELGGLRARINLPNTWEEY